MLNSDTVYEVIERLPQRDQQTTLLTLSLVNRSFFHMTRPVLFASVKWPHPDKTDDGGLSFFPEELWDYFKVFYLDWPVDWPECNPPLWGSKQEDEYTPKNLDKLETALPFMPNLRTFQMTCPFKPPLSLLQVLRGCASIKDLRITDTPVWHTLKDHNAPALFTAERIAFSPVAEAVRVGETHIDSKFDDFRFYLRAEYRSRYLDLITKRMAMNYIPAGWPFLPQCRTETMTFLQLSGDYYSLDDFSNPRLSFPALETLIMTGPCPIAVPGSAMTLPIVVSFMPKLRDLRVLISNTPTEQPLTMVPHGAEAPLAVYRQLTALAMSNEARDIDSVLRYACGLERLAISAIKPLPRLPIALRTHEMNKVLDNIRAGGGGMRLKQLRLLCEDDFDVAFFVKLGEVCRNLEVLELELCRYIYNGDDVQLWDVFTDAFSRYHHLKELRVGIRFPTCGHNVKPHCTPCISNWHHLCAVHFAQRLPTLQRIGFEYRTRRRKHEDRWMDFDIIRDLHGGLTVRELPTTWYLFPEVWTRVPLEE